MLKLVRNIGHHTLNNLQSLGDAGIFLLKIICRLPNLHQLWPSMRQQMYYIGFLSCLIMLVSGLFIGMVVGLQGYHTLEKFGAATHLGQLLALSITRELGPVLSALLFAGRAGSAITAEIGLMKATEQLDSMDMMAVDPLTQIIYPRFLVGIIALPLLTLIFSAIAVYGGFLIGVAWLGIDSGSFWSNMQAAVDFRADIMGGIIKSVVFAIGVIWISVYQGFRCYPTAEGICSATTRTVVYASLTVLGADVLLTAMMMGGL
jgi:phospholipid/cholesterol/gamma-HCH transport system permease protein